jgi:hypothetical protein
MHAGTVHASIPDFGQKNGAPGLTMQEMQAIEPRLPLRKNFETARPGSLGDGEKTIDTHKVDIIPERNPRRFVP